MAQSDILEFLKKNQHTAWTPRQICDELDCENIQSVYRNLSSLRKMDCVKYNNGLIYYVETQGD